jgi:hypothetical protein
VLCSAIRELNAMRTFKLKALFSLLHLPEAKQAQPLWPQNIQLLNLSYEERKLDDYDPDSTTLESA